MTPSRALFSIANPWHYTPTSDALFVDAVRDAAAYLLQHSPEFRQAADEVGFKLEALRSIDDLPRLPWIDAAIYKQRPIRCGDATPAVTFSSCGTRGPESDVALDRTALTHAALLRQQLMASQGITDRRPTNYLMLSYDQEAVGLRGAGWANIFLTRFAPIHARHFAVRLTADSQPTFDLDGAVAQLAEFASQPHPVRIIGFPDLIWRTVVAVQQQYTSLPLPEDSLLFHGGGWKGWSWTDGSGGRTAAMTALCAEVFELKRNRMREFFNFTEHCIPYMSDADGRLRIPLQSRVLARHPDTFEVVPPGSVGVLQFITPLNTLQPSLSLLSGDLGAVHRDETGRETILEVHGRIDPQSVSCADLAAEL